MKMKTRIFSLLLSLILILDVFTISPTQISAVDSDNETTVTSPSQEQDKNETYIEGKIKLACNGSDYVSLGRGEKYYAFATLDSSLGEKAKYTWEVMTDTGRWATISGYVSYYAVISEALLHNVATNNEAARLRCIASIGEEKYVSNILTVALSNSSNTETASPSDAENVEETPMMSAFSMRSQTDGSETTTETTVETTDEAGTKAASGSGSQNNTSSEAFQIVINYTYRHAESAPGLHLDGANAANTFTVTLPPNANYTGTVATPLEIGYLPYVKLDQLSYVTGTPSKADYISYDGEDYVLANSIEFVNQIDDVTVNVYYIPQKVTFRIKIYEQNLYDDEYTLAETITKTGIANARVGEGHNTDRIGFSPLYYDPDMSIDEDGSFALDIYYDRIYYLVDFDMNDNEDAYGVTNHYVRYKSTVVLPPPTRPGYNFVNWTLTSVKVDRDDAEQVENHSYPKTADGGYIIYSVEHNLNYQANWNIGKTTYTVIYWLENADDDGFTLDSFKVVEDVTPGTKVSAQDDLSIPDKSCFTFNSDLSDKDVVVSSDGTTSVNVYYLRKYYTMTFNGNAICITKEHTHTAECQISNCGLQPHTHSMDKCVKYVLTCTKTEHTHTDECEANECQLEEHKHTRATCESKVLSCQKEEHTHEGTDTCTLTEHIHDSTCCTKEYHVHGGAAVTDCIKPEHEMHHVECYSKETPAAANSLSGNPKTAYSELTRKVRGPLNGYIYRIRTRRNSTIYNFLYVHNTWFYLGQDNDFLGADNPNISVGSSAGSYGSGAASTLCGLEVHTHGDGNCTCSTPEHDHTSDCTCPETRHVHGEGNCVYDCDKEQHRHNVYCYQLDCGHVEHTHGGDCRRTCQQIEHTHTDSCQKKTTQNFLKFTAKYNANISSIFTSIEEQFTNGERWEDSGDTYFKEVLVYVPFMPPANITFKENAGTANKVYKINYYLESLGTTDTIVYKEKHFDWNNTISARYNYLTPDEDFFDIPGFTQFESDPAVSGGQIKDEKDYDVSLYYERNEYNLEFVSMGTTLSPYTQVLKYQQPIDESFELFAKDIPYPSNKEAGAIRFVGWYSTPTCAEGTEFYFDGNTTMPIGGLVLYAKWEACSYTVNVYSNVEMKETLCDPQTVYFDSFITEPDYLHVQHPGGLPDGEHPGYDDENHLIFAGWYYVVDGEEKRFDFNTMSVKFDMDIYAKWTSRVPVNYTVRYVYWDGTKYVDIAKATTGASLAGITKNFVAKVDTDLDDKFRDNFFPEVRSHSMTMSSNENENVFLFVYSSLDEVKYTVTHTFTDKRDPNSSELTAFEKIFGEGNNTLELTIEHSIKGESIKTQAAYVAVSFREGITKDNIIKAAQEQYKITLTGSQPDAIWDAITKLSPNFFIQNLILTTDSSKNNATFNWSNIGNQALYQIIYYKESIDGSEYIIHETKTSIVDVGQDIRINTEGDDKIIGIEYFEFDESNPLNKLSGKATATSIDPQTGVLTQGLVLKLYYTRNEYTYTVNYYKQGTTTELADSFEATAKYQQIISVSDLAKNIPGYILVNGSDQITISANNAQTIECLYQGLEVNYMYQVTGMGGTIVNVDIPDDPDSTNTNAYTDVVAIGGNPPASKRLELWNDGYFINAWYYSIGDGERKKVEDSWLSNDKTVISLPSPEVDLAGETVYVFAEVLPTTRRFSVEGFYSPENDPQAFVFRLKGKIGTSSAGIDITFAIYDDGYVDIARLPYGEYTLTTLHWAWRLDHPDTVTFNEQVLEAESGTVTLNLNAPGDVIITYPSNYNEHWLSDAASGLVPLYSPESLRQ